MKITLVSPLRSRVRDEVESEPTFPRIGLASIAAVLEQAGHEVLVIDPFIEGLSMEQFLRRIEQANPHWLGISAFTEEIIDAAELATEVKRRIPKVTTVIGGPHATAIPERTMKEFESFDIAVIGEGEQACLRLTQALASGGALSEVDGIAFRDGGEIRQTAPVKPISDINSLPIPAWHLFPLEQYRYFNPSGFTTRELTLPIEGARGCPFGCVFCYRVLGRNVRLKRADRFVDEIEHLRNKFSATRFHITEGTFGVNRQHAMAVCDELIKRGLGRKIAWETGGRVDMIDMPLLEKMKEAGCAEIGYGIESGDEGILRQVAKDTTLKQIHEAIANTRKAGIKAAGCFILGLPCETEETIRKTITLGTRLKLDSANFAILVPFPGTKVAEMAESGEGGLKLLSRDWSEFGKQSGKTLELESLPRQRLLALQRKAYRSVYLKPANLLRTLLTFRKTKPRKVLRLVRHFLRPD